MLQYYNPKITILHCHGTITKIKKSEKSNYNIQKNTITQRDIELGAALQLVL